MRFAIPLLLSALVLTMQPTPTQAQDAPLTAAELSRDLEKELSRQDENALITRIRAAAGKQDLSKGISPLLEGQTAGFAIETAQPEPTVSLHYMGGILTFPMRRIGKTNVYVYPFVTQGGDQEFPTGLKFDYEYKAGGQELNKGDVEYYPPDPDNAPQSNIPHGVVTKQPNWKSHVFEGTEREWWVYVPAQYKADTPACVMVFQDGQWYKDKVAVAFDNLIAKGAMPVTIGVFVSPGKFADGRENRSFEYDTLSDQYARLILDEMLPEVEKTHPLRHDAQSRAISGLSSGGICAFTAAWYRPEAFSKVLSWIGSFTGIQAGKTLREGGNTYPVTIRKTEPVKPIRVFLQDGATDLDNEHGNWPLANQEMAKALAYRKYDYKFVFGQGSHNDRHGSAMLAASLKWLWRDYKP